MISQHTHLVLRLAPIIGTALVIVACGSSPDVAPSSRTKTAVAASERVSPGERAAGIAMQQLGAPYRYGGRAPDGFDCSGLVQYAYRHAGVALPRTTGQLWEHSATVSHSDMQVGDLLFFSIAGKMQHVGLYIGEGRFVHAPSSGKVVSVGSLSNDYYRRALLRAGRPR